MYVTWSELNDELAHVQFRAPSAFDESVPDLKDQVKLLIERAMRDQTGADFALMNIGGVRDIIPEGQLKERNIWNVMPFDNRLVFKMKMLEFRHLRCQICDRL